MIKMSLLASYVSKVLVHLQCLKMILKILQI